MKNIQILLETVVRCGGNCSGCALSSSERMTKADFDFTSFRVSVKKLHSYLSEVSKEQPIEALSIFLGQGDHFLLSDDELKQVVDICSELVPGNLKHKTVILLTASAIGKTEDIQRKMDLIYDESSKLGIPMFIQTVFDPKKIVQHKNFKSTYMNNILYFKDKCGMTDLTINLGVDVMEQMTPQEFHNWVSEYKFNHVEMNWVINRVTQSMWVGNIDKMNAWLTDWMLIYKANPTYEINYIPIASRLLAYKDIPLAKAKPYIEEALIDNIYIDAMGNVLPCQMGPINNLTPVQERLSGQNIINLNNLLTGKQISTELKRVNSRLANKSIGDLMKNESCQSCKYITTCAIGGGHTWLQYQGKKEGCPWNIDRLYALLEKEFSDKTFRETVFHKNPVQKESLKKEGNETAGWFDMEVAKRISYEK